MKLQENRPLIYMLIIACGLLLFVPYLGEVHLFDWDELNFAESSREMLVTGDYFTVKIDYSPFHEKPPLFMIVQAVSMAIFGVNEFAARLPNAILGIIILVVSFNIGTRLFDEKFGILWVLSWIGSLLPHFYFKSGIIDPYFNFFIFLGIYYLSRYIYYLKEYKSDRRKQVILAGIFTGLAIMTKGPVGWLLTILVLVVVMYINRKEVRLQAKSIILFTLISALPAVIWYTIGAIINGPDLIVQFLLYQVRLLVTQDAGHGGPFYYHFVVILFGCFPASIIMLRSFRRQKTDTTEQSDFKIWMLSLLCVVLVVFSIVNTKIIHYSSLAYFPVTFLAAYAMYYISFREIGWKKSTSYLLIIIGLLVSAVLTAVPLLLMNTNFLLKYITDDFTRELLKVHVQWGGYEFLIGIGMFIGLIVSVVLFSLKKYLNGFILLFSSSALMIFILLPAIAPKIEPFTQGAPIEFYKSLQKKECYVQPLGFKSYAHFFYTQRPENASSEHLKLSGDDYQKWLLKGDIDLPAYFVCKKGNTKEYINIPGMIKLYEKNGYVFMVRYPS